jgi:hypothetical protein
MATFRLSVSLAHTVPACCTLQENSITASVRRGIRFDQGCLTFHLWIGTTFPGDTRLDHQVPVLRLITSQERPNRGDPGEHSRPALLARTAVPLTWASELQNVKWARQSCRTTVRSELFT